MCLQCNLVKRKPLTEAQRKVFDFIVYYKKANGWPPTRREIADHFGWKGHNAAAQHLWLMARKGYVKLIDNISRGIEIL
jgi:repressor LexA